MRYLFYALVGIALTATQTDAQIDQCSQDAINCKEIFSIEVCRFASMVVNCVAGVSNNQTSCPRDSQQVDQYREILSEHNCSLSVPQNTCYASITGCVDKLSSDKKALCSAFYKAKDCVSNKVLNNNQCPEDVKGQARSNMALYEDDLVKNYGCSATQTDAKIDQCSQDVINCKQIFSIEVCRFDTKVVNCVAGVSNNQTSCPHDSQQVDQYRAILSEHNCQLSVPQNTCYASITGCVDKLSSDKPAVCSAFYQAKDCVSNKVLNNNQCPEDVKGQARKMYEDDLVKNYGCSGVSSLMSSLALTLGLSSLGYLLTSLK